MTADQALKMLSVSARGGREKMLRRAVRHYHELAMLLHPDRDGGDLEKMKLLNEAMDAVRSMDVGNLYYEPKPRTWYGDWRGMADYLTEDGRPGFNVGVEITEHGPVLDHASFKNAWEGMLAFWNSPQGDLRKMQPGVGALGSSPGSIEDEGAVPEVRRDERAGRER